MPTKLTQVHLCSRQALLVGLCSLVLFLGLETWFSSDSGWRSLPGFYTLASGSVILLAGGAMWRDRNNQPLAWSLVYASWHIALIGGLWNSVTYYESCDWSNNAPPPLGRFFTWILSVCLMRNLASPLLMSVPIVWFLVNSPSRATPRSCRLLLPGLIAGLTSTLLLWSGFLVMSLLEHRN